MKRNGICSSNVLNWGNFTRPMKLLIKYQVKVSVIESNGRKEIYDEEEE